MIPIHKSNPLGVVIEVNFMRDLAIGKKYLKTLDQVPPNSWDSVEIFLKDLMRERAGIITRYSVSSATQEWRKRMANAGIPVETHIGEFKQVLKGKRVGKRTSTFVDDLRESKEPGIEYGVGTDGTDILHGSFKYQILAEAYANEYPEKFLKYLISRNIAPEDGYLGLGIAQENEILDLIQEKVSEYLGIEWVRAPWA